MYRVIIADDEPLVRTSLQVLINWADFDCEIVYVASDGKDVIYHIETCKPDIIVTDIKMPNCTGIDIAKYVKENKLMIKVIILTGFADFSFAQQAVKYDVIDYITKTGAFDGLELAIQKAKDQLVKESGLLLSDSKVALEENFLKSVIDGSLSSVMEIEDKIRFLKINLQNFVVMIFHFNFDDNIDNKKNYKISNSLNQFFQVAFKEIDKKIIPIRKNIFCIILNNVNEDYQKSIHEYCKNMLDMIENFMNLKVVVGISEETDEVFNLKKAYHHAFSSLNKGFLHIENKINFYTPEILDDKCVKETNAFLEEIYYYIPKGKIIEALNAFRKLLTLQKENNTSAKAIKNCGVTIANKCDRSLGEFELSLSNVIGIDSDVEQSIYNCIQVGDYVVLMEKIITQSLETINQYVQKKSVIIYDCQQYIDCNYNKNIMVADIAKKFSISPSYLSRMFKEETGNTIIATINEKRILQAKKLLSETDMMVYEVADALGFDNTTYFSHFFKKHTQMSPKDFKEHSV